MAPTGFRIHVWCKACRHSVDADPDALIRNGKGDIPLVQLKWQCANCRSGLTDFVVTGSHFGPNRSIRGAQIGRAHAARTVTSITPSASHSARSTSPGRIGPTPSGVPV